MLPEDYLRALTTLGEVFASYERRTGRSAVLVGGAAAAIYSAGEFQSGDFDIVAFSDDDFQKAMAEHGFLPEDRVGQLKIGFYHPDHLAYGFQQVSGQLFDGKSDEHRVMAFSVATSGTITLPAIEDLIADRLGPNAVAPPIDRSRLRRAIYLYRMALRIDPEY